MCIAKYVLPKYSWCTQTAPTSLLGHFCRASVCNCQVASVAEQACSQQVWPHFSNQIQGRGQNKKRVLPKALMQNFDQLTFVRFWSRNDKSLHSMTTYKQSNSSGFVWLTWLEAAFIEELGGDVCNQGMHPVLCVQQQRLNACTSAFKFFSFFSKS